MPMRGVVSITNERHGALERDAQMVHRTFTILEYMIEANGCGVTELAEALDLPKSTAHRLPHHVD